MVRSMSAAPATIEGMMTRFPASRDKLEDSRNALDGMEGARDGASFRAAFNSFLSAARAVTYALQKEGAHFEGFDEWYEVKRQEMRADELLRFIHDARIEDFHRGQHRLEFATDVAYLYGDAAGPPPTPNAGVVIGSDGAYWLVDEGTPRERRIPMSQGGKWTTKVGIANPPTTHRGQTLQRTDPVTLCRLVLGYLEEVVYEADSKADSAFISWPAAGPVSPQGQPRPVGPLTVD
jgi:hypothetical protein